MAKLYIEKYYDQSGREHTVKYEQSFHSFVIYVDGLFHARAFDRLQLRDKINALVTENNWSAIKPQKKYPAHADQANSGVMNG